MTERRLHSQTRLPCRVEIICTSGKCAGTVIGQVVGREFISHRKAILDKSISTDIGALQAAWDAGARLMTVIVGDVAYTATMHQIQAHGRLFIDPKFGDQWALAIEYWSEVEADAKKRPS